MKVKLLHEIGVHSVGAIIDIEDSNVIQLERNGMVERFTEQKESDIENKIEPTVKKKAIRISVKNTNNDYKGLFFKQPSFLYRKANQIMVCLLIYTQPT